MAERLDKKKKANVNEELENLEIKLNQFGEIETNIDIDKINAFLNENVEDKKLMDREDSQENDGK